MKSDIVLTSEAAKILDVTSDTVRDMERRGVLAAVRTGKNGTRLFARSAVEQLARERVDRHAVIELRSASR